MAPKRPGGRTANVRVAALDATADLLVKSGLEGVDLAEVARAAGVGKSTVYRRWGTVSALVTDLLADMAETSSPRPDTGSLAGDLGHIAALIQRTLADPRQGRLFAAIIAAATCSPDTATALAGFYRSRIDEFAGTVTDGIVRGEAPPGTDPADVIRYLSAPLYYRLLTGNGPPDAADAVRSTRAALAAVAAGVFVG
ncbi:TetR/AcrR family transcriptional regulator [Mycolicibacterium stellerae]|uniref:TetR/AcrR family transcriptional regulator n=1 Tax=Mycolicibacterium stellerae TaxID=2358193 RepID=UPI000F0B9562|nr:TetR/AcrR family transcriptional regulator [Mycolicibacterium stellerae]